MGRMVRKQVYIEERQEQLLKHKARQLGVTEAALVRRGIDEVCGVAPTRERSPDLRVDPWASWAREEEYIRSNRSFLVPQTADRGWTREELYDERLARFSH